MALVLDLFLPFFCTQASVGSPNCEAKECRGKVWECLRSNYAPTLPGPMTLGKSLYFPMPQLPHLQTGWIVMPSLYGMSV